MAEAAGFWDWAVAAYGRPNVQGLCLALQDEGGQSVPYLLWAAWMAAEGRVAADGVLRAGATLAASWEAGAVAPLRQARRWLKGQGDEALRARVKAAELGAERALMDRLQALASAPSQPSDMAAALRLAAAAWPRAADPAALGLLAAALR
jgi:uncharacterized protein (TIGR02444 family)